MNKAINAEVLLEELKKLLNDPPYDNYTIHTIMSFVEAMPEITELKYRELIGKPIWKLRAKYTRHFPTDIKYYGGDKNYNYLIDSTYSLKMTASDPEITIVPEERSCTKTDVGRLGHYAFLTRAEAEEAIAKARAKYGQ